MEVTKFELKVSRGGRASVSELVLRFARVR
jgi:hypothetical protein